jgi:glutathione synthase/RimK-type ligase-like ATP-grasp enzyme
MKTAADDCCILNGGSGAWAFAPLADQLSGALGVPVSAEPRRLNYLLHLDALETDFRPGTFIPLAAIRLAADKRLLAEAFQRHGVPTPRTFLLETFPEVIRHVGAHPGIEWCLKFPTGCGASGHRLVVPDSSEPANWPRPFILQEFIRLERPEVYRVYGAGGELFGWVARRFLAGKKPSPWVAHARGARYERAGEAPEEALAEAGAALRAVGLDESFGCVDLVVRPSGEWLVLEVGTDGVFNYVDRELNDGELEAEVLARIARAFWQRAGMAQR